MRGEELQTTVELLSTYNLQEQDELRRWRLGRRTPCRRVDSLTVYAGYICLCDGENLRRRGGSTTLPSAPNSKEGRETWSPSSSLEGGKLFDGLRDDLRQAARDLDEKVAVVEDTGKDRVDREPWLVYTGFATRLRGIRDVEIKPSYELPQGRDLFSRMSPKGRAAGRKEKGGGPCRFPVGSVMASLGFEGENGRKWPFSSSGCMPGRPRFLPLGQEAAQAGRRCCGCPRSSGLVSCL
ncbi:hypothetical protein V8C42DRAFT_337355 [Trichoderma barbatum]